MKKILFILIIFANMLFGHSECKTDVYFANGILTNERNAAANMALLEKTIKKELYNSNDNLMKQSIGKFKRSYNQTEGVVLDILEAIGQKVSSTFDGKKQTKETKMNDPVSVAGIFMIGLGLVTILALQYLKRKTEH